MLAYMTGPISHFVFSESFAGSLVQALRQAGRTDAAFCFADDLAFGPIDPPDPATRLEWIERELFIDFGDRDLEIKRLNAFWIAATAAASRVVWVSKRVARERADFLEWVWRMGDAPYDIIEFDEAHVTYHRPDGQTRRASVNSLALLPPEHLAAARYWDQAKVFDAAQRDRCREVWARLRRENAPLRILDQGELVSAPLSFFDDLIISCVVKDWRKIARVVGEAVGNIYDAPFLQTGDWVLRARVVALAEAGRLESRGDLSSMRSGEVRLPAENAR
jgi:hypothetical protein